MTARHLYGLKEEVTELLLTHGPQPGDELIARLDGVSPIALWRLVYGSERFRVQNCARYYLRYDIRRGNQLRLSPSILRDFLTFSLVYLPEQQVAVVETGTRMANKFRQISLRKLARARQALLQIEPDLIELVNRNCVVFVSGDIAYYLAHDTLRRHEEFNTPIKGSDIDIVVVSNNEADPAMLKRLESALLTMKKIFLLTPAIREEIDFIVKPIDKMIAQLSYGDIHEKIASKILYESYFIMGRVDIYESLISHMRLRGALAKIERDFETALMERKNTIAKILALPPDLSVEDPDVASLFFASQERLEFQ